MSITAERSLDKSRESPVDAHPNGGSQATSTSSCHRGSSYPVTLYLGPIQNTGRPRADGKGTMRHVDLDYLIDGIRTGKWAEWVAEARELAAHKDERGDDGKRTKDALAYDQVKRQLPFWIAAGHFVPGHRHAPDQPQSPSSTHGNAFPECVAAEGRYPPVALSGLRFVEIDHLDNPDDLARARARIQEHPSVVTCWRSAGGNGLHVTVLMDPAPATDAESHVAWWVASRGLAISAIGDKSVKNLARVAFVSHDPDAYVNRAPIPLAWNMPEISPQASDSAAHARQQPGGGLAKAPGVERRPWGRKTPLGDSGKGPGTQEDRLAQAWDLIPPPEDYNHWLGWISRFKAAGLTAGEVDAWSRRGTKYVEGEVVKRWDSLPGSESVQEAVDIIVGYAVKHHGLQPDHGRRRSGNRGANGGKGGNVGNSKAGAGGKRRRPPPPLPEALTPVYQAAWLAYTAHDVLVVVREDGQSARDGRIGYTLYAVDAATGLLDRGELMTKWRVKAAKDYLVSCANLSKQGFTKAAAHAYDMQVAKSASEIAGNVVASREAYPQVWDGIPFHSSWNLDADLSVIGTPSGVWSIPDHRILTPEEARMRLVSIKIRWDYDPGANHPVALELFESLYGDLQDTTTAEFSRWLQAATALVRRARKEIIVKISDNNSAKTTEGNLQINAFSPLVMNGERAAIEASSGYNSGGATHNSYLADFARPARRINVQETAADNGKRQKPLDSQLLRTLSEASALTYREPGPHPRKTVPYDAHLFIDGNWPHQGQDLLHISATGSDSAEAVRSRLRGSPYTQIPVPERKPELRNYGDPADGTTSEKAADIEEFNKTIVRMMLDGMTTHWQLLSEGELPQDEYSRQVIDELQTRGRAEWLVQWVPLALRPTMPGEACTHTLAVYWRYLAWHDEHGEGKPATRRAVTVALSGHYQVKMGARLNVPVDGKQKAANYLPEWALAEE